MPIKEIIVFAVGVATVAIVANPLHVREALRKAEVQIVRDVGTTRNWGNPSIFMRIPANLKPKSCR